MSRYLVMGIRTIHYEVTVDAASEAEALRIVREEVVRDGVHGSAVIDWYSDDPGEFDLDVRGDS